MVEHYVHPISARSPPRSSFPGSFQGIFLDGRSHSVVDGGQMLETCQCTHRANLSRLTTWPTQVRSCATRGNATDQSAFHYDENPGTRPVFGLLEVGPFRVLLSGVQPAEPLGARDAGPSSSG